MNLPRSPSIRKLQHCPAGVLQRIDPAHSSPPAPGTPRPLTGARPPTIVPAIPVKAKGVRPPDNPLHTAPADTPVAPVHPAGPGATGAPSPRVDPG